MHHCRLIVSMCVRVWVCVCLHVFVRLYRKENRQVCSVWCHSTSDQCGDWRGGEGGPLPRTVHMPSWGNTHTHTLTHTVITVTAVMLMLVDAGSVLYMCISQQRWQGSCHQLQKNPNVWSEFLDSDFSIVLMQSGDISVYGDLYICHIYNCMSKAYIAILHHFYVWDSSPAHHATCTTKADAEPWHKTWKCVL